ncbi:hypothetical protein [Klebsiella michiganensis]|uniref:hypothetical protein n=1 Tax=Klebsiella michiganensis TaxID=1134687 RepID=UPI000ADAE18B|nr:hypothetical protein [Klebsiella michiganensis]
MKKGIRDVFSACDIRRVTSHDNAKWSRGPTTYMAIRWPTWTDAKTDKLSAGSVSTSAAVNSRPARITSGDFVGACFVIGNLNGAQNIAVVEGFATGASVWLATRKDPKKSFDAVVVAVAANNMTHVVEQLVNMYPAAKNYLRPGITTANHPAEGKGNTGLRTGYDIMEKFSGVKCVYPTFEDDLSRNAAILTTCTA